MNISAIIIAKNEEGKIADCLKSLVWCDELIVVDNASMDKTAKIAKSYGAKVISVPERYSFDYSYLRNQGLKASNGEWILYVDADERVTTQLQGEILEKIKTHDWQDEKISAYVIPRENIILGKKLMHGGWWPDYVKRLFRRDKIKGWKGELHEEPVFEGSLGHLENPLIHIKHDNLFEMVEKTNKWSEIEARLMFEAGHPKMNIPRFCSAMFREFWIRMIKYKAFLDGSVGVIYALYQVFSRFISYAKLWEMQLKNQKSNI